jgi:hypothetical protein
LCVGREGIVQEKFGDFIVNFGELFDEFGALLLWLAREWMLGSHQIQ